MSPGYADGAARQSVPARGPESGGFGHTATARYPRVYAVAAADRHDQSPTCVPCRPDTVGLSSRYGPPRDHSAGRTPQHQRHGPYRMAVGQAQTHGLTFFGTQVSV